jgi:hypothetical protein
MQTRQFEIGKPSPDVIQRTGNFELLPVIPQLPIITSQPSNNINQYTWVRGIRRGRYVFQKARPIDGEYKALEGTELRWTFYAHDPDNVLSQNPYSGLSFKWKKDGIDLTSLNLLNAERGVKSVKISREACTPDLTGQYICEITNLHGTVETFPLNLRIFSAKNYPKLYTNLLKNGNAESDLDGWSIEPGIVSSRFGDQWQTDNASSLGNLGSWYRFKRPVWEQPTDFDPAGNKRYVGERFRFSQGSDPFKNQLYPWIHRADQQGENWKQWPEVPDWMKYNTDRFSSEIENQQFLKESNRWGLTSFRANLVSNEHPWDGFGTFFPSMRLIDIYNSNTGSKVVGLEAESKDKQLSYFTRDKIKFEKFGGQPTTTMRQTVAVSDLADFVDGNVYGVAHLTYQFFAYVGIGITGYKIKVQKPNGDIDQLNWNIASTEDFYTNICTPGVSDAGRITIAPGSDIEIIPLTEDITDVTLNFRDENGAIIKIEKVKTPTAFDIWALKEKAYLPISFGPLFLFIKNAVTSTASSNIKVFGQTITTTGALAGMFGQERSPFVRTGTEEQTLPNVAQTITATDVSSTIFYISKLPAQSPLRGRLQAAIVIYNWFIAIGRSVSTARYHLIQELNQIAPPPLTISIPDENAAPTYGMTGDALNAITDVNAKFLGQKLPFGVWGQLWPTFWDLTDPANNGVFPRRNKALRCIEERGAAAMIAIDSTGTTPKRTRDVEIVVNFKHKSDVFYDNNPEGKGWDEQELYADHMGYGQAADETGPVSGNSRRFTQYGNPRCGITKMKLVMLPNNFVPDQDYPSYKLPPAEFTVLGKSKQFVLTNDINTAAAQSFVLQDDFTRPDVPTPLAGISDVFTLNPDGISYLSIQQYDDQDVNLENEFSSWEQSQIDETLVDSSDAHTDAAILGLGEDPIDG